MLVYFITAPILAGIILFFTGRLYDKVKIAVSLAITGACLVMAVKLFGSELRLDVPWAGYGIDFSLRLYQFSGFILIGASFFAFLVTLYSSVFMSGKNSLNHFYSYLLISVGFINGAVLSDNLILLLFFWEGLLCTLLGMIAIGSKNAFPTAIKAFIIVGVSDLCLMLGIGLAGHLAGTFTISKIHLTTEGLGALTFIFLMIGAISKAGAMPFHSWIPDAAIEAPLPFMALFPAAFEKLLGIYFLARITLDMFNLQEQSWLSTLLMTLGVLTILFAVLMALIQKDYKRLLSFHAISQVGYMVLGIGTCVPAGIVGGLFHMINHALYKSCLFLTGGAVELQAGTTDLKKLGNLRSRMPITFTCFVIAAAAISGVPPFNGFFSKELVYDGALERGFIYYFGALLGSFLTAASFLKLGHAAYFGKSGETLEKTKEAPWQMLLPMITIAATCVIFGLFNFLPLRNLIQPILGDRLAGNDYSGLPTNMMLVLATLVVLAAAWLNHQYGFRKGGSGVAAADHIHHAPVFNEMYDKAENRFFDPYEIGLKFVGFAASVLYLMDRLIDWIYDYVSVQAGVGVSLGIRAGHTGNYSVYLAWSLIGSLLLTLFLLS